MKNSFHILFIFLLSFLAHLCGAMVKNILIKNGSNKNYEFRCEAEFHELPKGAQRLIPLIWSSLGNKRVESNIEFYDTSDPWFAECKSQKLCSLILYSHIFAVDGKIIYQAKLERKRPNLAMIKEFTGFNLCGLQRFSLTITDDLEATELKDMD